MRTDYPPKQQIVRGSLVPADHDTSSLIDTGCLLITMHIAYHEALLLLFFVNKTACYSDDHGGNKCRVKLDLTFCETSAEFDPNDTSVECSSMPVCRKHFNISYVMLRPYTSAILAELLHMCCGSCMTYTEVDTLEKISHINSSVMNVSHFVFPLLGRTNAHTMHGYHYIPFLDTPIIYYVTLAHEEVMHGLLDTCIQLWPLIVVLLLMNFLSGFICWVCETWGNFEEFPRNFFRGWGEGIWWSFVSMTTVGYGDKAPRSFLGRVFAVAWIIVAIIAFSLVSASIITKIDQANNPPPKSMDNKRVGAIRHHLYEAMLIAKHGGIIMDFEDNAENVTEGIRSLTTMLETHKIDGFVIDRYTLLIFMRSFKDDPHYQDIVTFIKTETKYEELPAYDKFSYGALVKYNDDFELLSEFAKDNRDVINMCFDLYVNKDMADHEKSQSEAFDKHSLFTELFAPTAISLSAAVAVVCLFGALYEFYRRSKSYQSVTLV